MDAEVREIERIKRENAIRLAEATRVFLRCVDNGYFGKRGLRESPVVEAIRKAMEPFQ